MASKMFCDRCGKEIDLKNGQYDAKISCRVLSDRRNSKNPIPEGTKYYDFCDKCAVDVIRFIDGGK